MHPRNIQFQPWWLIQDPGNRRLRGHGELEKGNEGDIEDGQAVAGDAWGVWVQQFPKKPQSIESTAQPNTGSSSRQPNQLERS